MRHLREKLERDSRNPELHPHRTQRRVPLPRQVNPLRTVGGRLALALLVVVGGALAIVYLIVVPSYRSSLVDSRLKDLRHTRRSRSRRSRETLRARSSRARPGSRTRRCRRLRGRASSCSAPRRSSSRWPTRTAGRRATSSTTPWLGAPPALDGVVSAAVTRDGSTYAEAAVSLKGGAVLLVATPLHDDLESVAVVQVAGARRREPRHRLRDRARLRACDAVRPPHQAARGRSGADRRRAVRRAGRRRCTRRARPAGPGVRPDAPAPRLARPRAWRVHRQRLPRAADAALLARRLPRAARRRRASMPRPGRSSSPRCGGRCSG